MNLVFKIKVFGFLIMLVVGGAVHIATILLPGKKIRGEYPDYPEISSVKDELRG